MDGRAADVVRHRLVERLTGRFARPLTLIEAGAGFGKSTLLNQLIDEAARLHRGVDALVTVPPSGLGAVALVGALGAAVNPTAQRCTTASELVDLVWAASPEEVCLMVDDVHWLEADTHRLLNDLIDGLPLNGHLLLAGRRLPDGLPTAELRAAGKLDLLVDRDLAFDHDEQVAYAAARGKQAGDWTSSGWPALLELEHASGRSGAVRFLLDEVVASMDPDHRAACVTLAVPPVIDDQLVAEATDHRGGVEALIEGLPLTTIAADGTAQFHQLLREALLDSALEHELQAAHLAVGSVLERRRDYDAAVNVYAAVDDLEGIGRITRQLAEDLHLGAPTAERAQLVATLGELLGDSLEVEVVSSIFASMDDPGRAIAPLELAAARAAVAGDADLEALCRLRLADLAYAAADPDRLLVAADRVERLAECGSAAAARVRFLPQIWWRSLTNRHADVLTYIAAQRADPAVRLDADTAQLLTFYAVINQAYTGHLRRALREAEELAHLPGGLFANRLAGFVWVQRWQLGEMTADQLPEVVRLLDLIEELGETHLFVEGTATTALFHASLGDVATARVLTDRAGRQAHRLPDTAWAHHSVAQARAVLAVFDGNEEQAATILHEAIPPGGVATLPRFIYGVTASLSYVLCPSTREVWDADQCGPDHVLRRDVGRALVALRERGETTPAAHLPWDAVERLRPWAYEPHLTELAVAAVSAGNHLADGVFATLRHDPHRALVSVAERLPRLAGRATAIARDLPRRSSVRIEVNVLGDPELRRDGRPVVDEQWVRRQRVRDLLLLLVEHRTIGRVELAELMWPDKPAGAAAGNLRFTLNQLVSALEPDREASEAPWFVRVEGSRLVLAGGDRLVVDADQFDGLVQSASFADRTGSPHRALELYREACGIYRGDYLSGTSDREWGYYEAIRLRGRFVVAASRAAELLVSAGRIAEGEELAVRAAEAEPDSELAVGAVATALLADRRFGTAREVVGKLLDDLRRAGLPPETRTAHLARRLGIETHGIEPDG